MKIDLLLGDSTTIRVDAIVNAANSSLLGGSGVAQGYINFRKNLLHLLPFEQFSKPPMNTV